MKIFTKCFAVLGAVTAAAGLYAADAASYLPADSQLAFYISMPAAAASQVLPANGINISECLAEAAKKNPGINQSLLTAEIAAGGMWSKVNDPASGKGVVVMKGSEELIAGCCAAAEADENCKAAAFAGFQGFEVVSPELAAKNIRINFIKIDANTVMMAVNMDEAAAAACAAGGNSNILTSAGVDGCLFAAAAENNLNQDHPFFKFSAKIFEADGHITFSSVTDLLDDSATADMIEKSVRDGIAGAPALAAAYGVTGLEEVFAGISVDRKGNVMEMTVPQVDTIVKQLIPVLQSLKEQKVCWDEKKCEADEAELY